MEIDDKIYLFFYIFSCSGFQSRLFSCTGWTKKVSHYHKS